MDNNLGQIKKVNLRDIWEDEARDFTQWLVQEENISLLSDEIGIEVGSVQSEADVGDFNVDILAEEEGGNRSIIIENQLEKTDHDHLGKLLTYAAGYSADIIIWIFKDIREEHRQAIDWLNQNSDEGLAFFGVKIEAWKIGDSKPAPKFNIISKPNEWAKILKRQKETKELTETKAQQLDFWTQFKDYGEDNIDLNFRTPQPQNWYQFSSSFSSIHITASMNTRKQELSCGIYINKNKELFDYLKSKQEKLEESLDQELEFSMGEKDGRILVTKDGHFKLGKEEKYEEYFSWLLDNVSRTKEIFEKHIKEFKKK